MDMAPEFAKLRQAGVAAIIITETNEGRDNWAEISQMKVGLVRRQGNLFMLRDAAAESFAKVNNGMLITISGEPVAGPSTNTWNAIGKITGSDPTLSSQVILLSSHLDHLGVRPTDPGDDKIYNGADDDASGSVAVLELARTLAAGKRPKRTVYFVCFGSEEMGGFGANYFVNNLPFPKENLVANLEFEMIGRPDPKVKPDELWLTGYERSNLGPELANRGARLVQDPHPEENFFQRSDNYTLARQGIIAHTVSSFGLHTDYHRASDEVKTIDFGHMTRSIDSMVTPIQWLVNSNFKPAWNPGKNPAPQ
jgi:Zn-dependent M28 family amino/carboxypeptidase